MVFENKILRALILENKTADDVSRAMIESGRQKEPFYIFDMDLAYERIEHFRKMMPRIKIFYAMKANDSNMMIKLAASLGLGFDCASPGEIHKILKINVSPLNIIFAVTSKTPEWMTYARQSGIKYTTFDSSNELNKIKKYWPEARLLIRIRVDGNSVYKLGEKFGCDFETEAIDLLEQAAALNIRVIGVAYHVGRFCFSADGYILGLQQAKVLFEHETKAGREMNIIDIGGGFMSDRTDRIDESYEEIFQFQLHFKAFNAIPQYRYSQSIENVEILFNLFKIRTLLLINSSVSKHINSKLEELFPDPNIQVIAEPGGYLCDNSYTLYCNINNMRRVPKGDAIVNMIYINDGVHGTFRNGEPWHTVKRYEKSTDSKNKSLEPVILWGPSCDPNDRVMKNVELMLPRCTLNDWLVFPSQGAYTLTMVSRFSSLEGPSTRTVISGELLNKIKDSEIFEAEDFMKQDISEPLPTTLPPVVVQTRLLHSNCTLKL